MNAEAVREVKDAHLANAHKDVDARAVMRGWGPQETATLKAAVKPPLIAFADGYGVHFVGPDARRAAEILDVPPVDRDGQPQVSIDARLWNKALDQLQAAGHEVAVAAMPGA